MSCRVIVLEEFKRDAKKLLKKYKSLKSELAQFEKEVSQNPRTGTLVGKNTYKVRLAVKSKGRGKSGGLRVITHVIEVLLELAEEKNPQYDTSVFLMAIYDKSDFSNITDQQITYLIEEIQKRFEDEE